MGTRLKFLGLAVIFAMMAFLGAAFIANGMGRYVRWWFLLITASVFCVLSLVGVFCPGRMQWLLDAWQKLHSKDEE